MTFRRQVRVVLGMSVVVLCACIAGYVMVQLGKGWAWFSLHALESPLPKDRTVGVIQEFFNGFDALFWICVVAFLGLVVVRACQGFFKLCEAVGGGILGDTD